MSNDRILGETEDLDKHLIDRYAVDTMESLILAQDERWRRA